jgi:predicted HTH transcriptional regulator
MFQQSGLYSYELSIVRKASLNDFDQDEFKKYLSVLGVTSDNPNEMILEGLGFIGYDEELCKYKPTIGGLLLFGKQPENFMQHNYIKVVNGEEQKYFYGNIPTLLKDIENYLKMTLDEKYPIHPLLLAVTNAIVHRDYTDITRGISIEIDEKNIVITNPGALLAENLLYKIEKDMNPKKRNPWLYQRLITLENKGGVSSEPLGMKKIKQAFKEVKFLNIGTQNLFKVVIPRNIE